jgi:hypothetical protein
MKLKIHSKLLKILPKADLRMLEEQVSVQEAVYINSVSVEYARQSMYLETIISDLRMFNEFKSCQILFSEFPLNVPLEMHVKLDYIKFKVARTGHNLFNEIGSIRRDNQPIHPIIEYYEFKTVSGQSLRLSAMFGLPRYLSEILIMTEWKKMKFAVISQTDSLVVSSIQLR